MQEHDETVSAQKQLDIDFVLAEFEGRSVFVSKKGKDYLIQSYLEKDGAIYFPAPLYAIPWRLRDASALVMALEQANSDGVKGLFKDGLGTMEECLKIYAAADTKRRTAMLSAVVEGNA